MTDNVNKDAVRDASDDGSIFETDYSGSYDDQATNRTVESRSRLRNQMSADVEAFLAKGGQIQVIESNVIAQPVTRVESDYGSRPI